MTECLQNLILWPLWEREKLPNIHDPGSAYTALPSEQKRQVHSPSKSNSMQKMHQAHNENASLAYE